MKIREPLESSEMKSLWKKIKKKRLSTKSCEERMWDASGGARLKTLIVFYRENCKSIKSLIMKNNTNVKMTSRFINGKMVTLFGNISYDFCLQCHWCSCISWPRYLRYLFVEQDCKMSTVLISDQYRWCIFSICFSLRVKLRNNWVWHKADPFRDNSWV